MLRADTPPSAIGRCYRCGYTWHPRSTRPRICPRCKSKYWRVPVIRPLPHDTGLGIEDVLGRHRREIRRLAAKHHVVRLRVFGSLARNAARPSSDADFLVEFGPEATGWDQIGLAQDLQHLLRKKVDVATPEGLHWLARPQALIEGVLL